MSTVSIADLKPPEPRPLKWPPILKYQMASKMVMGKPGIVNTWQPEDATISDSYNFITAGYNGEECVLYYRRAAPGCACIPSPSDCDRMF